VENAPLDCHLNPMDVYRTSFCDMSFGSVNSAKRIADPFEERLSRTSDTGAHPDRRSAGGEEGERVSALSQFRRAWRSVVASAGRLRIRLRDCP